MESFTQTVFVLFYWAGWMTLAILAFGLLAFLIWLYSTARTRPPQPRQQVDFRREDVE